ncbi:MAG: hypothetical protein ABIR33_12005 [Pyrinomonadaceae bacterium]
MPDTRLKVEIPWLILHQKGQSCVLKVLARYTIAQSQISNPGSSGKNLVLISVDLPSSGYTDNIDYEDVSPLAEIGTVKLVPVPDFQATGRTPMLDFIETFIVRLAETLETKVPVKYNFTAVMGGSPCGNRRWSDLSLLETLAFSLFTILREGFLNVR